MKKDKSLKKLVLSKETLRSLGEDHLKDVAAAAPGSLTCGQGSGCRTCGDTCFC